jgi:hypothetical protein
MLPPRAGPEHDVPDARPDAALLAEDAETGVHESGDDRVDRDDRVTAIIAIYAIIAGLVYAGLGIFSKQSGVWSRIGHCRARPR